MKLLVAAFTAVLLSGCAAPVYKHEIANIQKSESVHFEDTRPKYESEQKLFSALITSDAYGTYRYSTQTLDPSALRLFQHKVYEKFATSAQPADVKVFHFVSYMNMQSSFRKSVMVGMFTGGIRAAVAASVQNYHADFRAYSVSADSFEKTAGDSEYTRAFFTEEENPDKVPVFVVYIDAEVNGKRSFVKGLAPSVRKDDKNPYMYAVENTIQAFLKNY